MTTWVVVAHRGGARFLRRESRSAVELLREFDNPRGRLRDEEIDADRPGSGHSRGGTRHAVGNSDNATEHVAQEFAKELAKELNRARVQGEFDRLILVAGPAFLGMLRSALDKNTEGRVAEELHKDLAHANDREVADFLRDIPLV